MSLYDDLGVPKDADAEAIKKAYRRKAQRVHPDKPTGSEDEFKTIERAYAVLSDERKRSQYDKTGTTGEPDINQQAQTVIATMFLSMVDIADLDHDDVVAAMKESVRERIRGFRSQIEKSQTKMKRMYRAMKRIKRTGTGENVLKMVTEHAIAGIEKSIAEANENIAFSELVLKLLGTYEYEVDVKTPIHMPGGLKSVYYSTGGA